MTVWILQLRTILQYNFGPSQIVFQLMARFRLSKEEQELVMK